MGWSVSALTSCWLAVLHHQCLSQCQEQQCGRAVPGCRRCCAPISRLVSEESCASGSEVIDGQNDWLSFKGQGVTGLLCLTVGIFKGAGSRSSPGIRRESLEIQCWGWEAAMGNCSISWRPSVNIRKAELEEGYNSPVVWLLWQRVLL